jgi:hypothetical protein
VVLLVVIPCSHANGYQCLKGTCCLHLQGINKLELRCGWVKKEGCRDQSEGSKKIGQSKPGSGFSKTMITTYMTVWCHNPEDNNLSFHHCENLKSQKLKSNFTCKRFNLQINHNFRFVKDNKCYLPNYMLLLELQYCWLQVINLPFKFKLTYKLV